MSNSRVRPQGRQLQELVAAGPSSLGDSSRCRLLQPHKTTIFGTERRTEESGNLEKLLRKTGTVSFKGQGKEKWRDKVRPQPCFSVQPSPGSGNPRTLAHRRPR